MTSLRVLVTAPVQDWATQSICCKDTGCGTQPDAFLLPARAHFWPAPSTSADVFATDITVFIASAARPRDDGTANTEMLVNAIHSARLSLALNRSVSSKWRAVVSLQAHPIVPHSTHPIPSHPISFHRIALHRIASHRIASHPNPSEPITSIPSHPIPSHPIPSHRVPPHPIHPHPADCGGV